MNAEEWVDVGPATQVTETTSLNAEVDGYPVMVLRCGANLYAVENTCTHDGETLTGAEVENCEIICPRHGARFCLKTGEALTPPAYDALRRFEVREENGRVLVKVPE